MLKNDRVTTFTVSELLRKNQQGERGKIPSPPSPRLELRILIEKKQSQMKLQRLRKV